MKIPARIPSRWRIALLVLAAGFLVVLIALWSQRKPIAAGFVDRTLAARGVRGSYRIAELGVGRQRLVNLRIGDPASPDLVAAEVELTVGYGISGPEVRSIKARGVRLRGTLAGGRVSFGAVDRLLPKPSGGPFALPGIKIDVSDARMRLATPAGAIGLAVDGRGKLSDGFKGRVAAVAHALAIGGCRVAGGTANVDIAIADRRPTFAGPVRIASADCGKAHLAGGRANIDAHVSEGFDRWSGSADLAVMTIAQGANHIDRLAGRLGFSGDAKRTRGAVRLTSGPAAVAGMRARSTRFDGAYALGTADAGPTLSGRFGAAGSRLDGVVPASSGFAGTPVGPLADALVLALRRATADAEVDGRIALASRSSRGAVRLSDVMLAAASGARVTLSGGSGVTYYWPSGGVRVDTVLASSGGGLPTARATLRQARPGAPITGLATMTPYATGGAKIALTPVTFTVGEAGSNRFTTRVTLDGPLAGGRVTGLSLPLDARIPRGGFVLNPGCAPLSFATLDVAGAHFGQARLTLCPTEGALVSRSGGHLRGGGRIVAPRLSGRSGSAPLTVTAAALRFALASPGFTIDALQVRLGDLPRQTRLDVARLDGSFGDKGLAGRFAGAAGQIGAVPLLLSEGEGPWRLVGGTLSLEGGLRVADTARSARFEPMVADDVRLRLASGAISATATLREPQSKARVMLVTLGHDLPSGIGNAILDVPELRFGKDLQPEALTRLTLGVVANVEGALQGRGEIRWNPEGVASTGRFATDRIDLAAAFGPVTGIKGEIAFTDLLGLETAPGQTATIAEVNPGIVVNGGVVRYRLLAGQKVRIEGGRWPFSGGALLLQPTVMDFGQPSARHLAFEVEGLDAARFVQQLQFENIAATGTFDGVIPMVFDEKGGRIVGGRLIARKGGGTLAYVGEVTKANLGVFGKMAFDALKSIRYQALAIDLDGALDGEIVSRVLFNGVNQQPLGSDTPFVKELKGLPFKFNITVRAPFRGLVGSARSLADPTAMIRDYLPAKPAQTPVQPPVSEDKP